MGCKNEICNYSFEKATKAEKIETILCDDVRYTGQEGVSKGICRL